MRAFVVLSFIAVASAGRLGYNYQVGGGSGILSSGSGSLGSVGSGIGIGSGLSGSSLGLGSGIGGGSSLGLGSGIGGGSSLGLGSGIGGGSGLSLGSGIGGGSGLSLGSGIGGGSGLGLGSGIGGSSGFGIGGGSGLGFGGGSLGSSGLGGGQVIDGGLNKEFYTYSAPEEEFYDGAPSQRIAGALKRNLRVVFIKAPENNAINNAALQLVKQATQDKTAIYVLSKQADISELADQVQNLRSSVQQKPEVRFIKYRTPQDAINAQRSIQQQYDNLGGSTRVSDEGLAPVLNYASAAQPIGLGHNSGIDFGSSGSASSISRGGVLNSSSKYLPPIVY